MPGLMVKGRARTLNGKARRKQAGVKCGCCSGEPCPKFTRLRGCDPFCGGDPEEAFIPSDGPCGQKTPGSMVLGGGACWSVVDFDWVDCAVCAGKCLPPGARVLGSVSCPDDLYDCNDPRCGATCQFCHTATAGFRKCTFGVGDDATFPGACVCCDEDYRVALHIRWSNQFDEWTEINGEIGFAGGDMAFTRYDGFSTTIPFTLWALDLEVCPRGVRSDSAGILVGFDGRGLGLHCHDPSNNGQLTFDENQSVGQWTGVDRGTYREDNTVEWVMTFKHGECTPGGPGRVPGKAPGSGFAGIGAGGIL